jgi:hypothetical protein
MADRLPLLTSKQMAQFVAAGFVRFDGVVDPAIGDAMAAELDSGRELPRAPASLGEPGRVAVPAHAPDPGRGGGDPQPGRTGRLRAQPRHPRTPGGDADETGPPAAGRSSRVTEGSDVRAAVLDSVGRIRIVQTEEPVRR